MTRENPGSFSLVKQAREMAEQTSAYVQTASLYSKLADRIEELEAALEKATRAAR